MINQDSLEKNIKNVCSTSVMTFQDLGISADREAAKEGFSVVVRTLLQNWRQGTVGSKTRSQVSGSNKKPWKQKGTGRARAGAVTSPLWRGGGVIFGPQARTRMLKVSKKQRRAVSCELLKQFISSGKVIVVDWLPLDVPKTQHAYKAINSANLLGKNINIFIPTFDNITALSFSNIPCARILFFDSANAYVLADSFAWIVFKRDIELFKDMVSKWI